MSSSASPLSVDDRLLIALDIDGTILQADDTISDAVHEQITRLVSAGHEVMLATGRSASMTFPIARRLGITPEYLVCSNGAVVLRRTPDAPDGYTRAHVETFLPGPVLTTISAGLPGASFAVEDENSFARYIGNFPVGALGEVSEKVSFDELFIDEATRVIVVSDNHGVDDFLRIVETMGLHQVSYNVGWTAWLDIAPDGVNKATGMERVRDWLGVPRSRIVAVGDGNNDIEMFEWARIHGRAVAMGQAAADVKEAAGEVTASDAEDGLARVLSGL